ncbi:hypothetical protein [Polaromonas sp. SM01]|uniref:hypothetical protein n=1 Tax=Polaromonas sp. SM01 TaxID=3085630 RepID=UPI002980FA0F|nr:hypothetical protein [Polaromonas sp. SM01]MDW5441515.1 hypothetical protein [Polaromonas sp. SM01]
MRRWLIVLLFVFVPLQLSWAAVSAYCQHETGSAAQHVGHHQHQHQADPDQGDSSKPTSTVGMDADCGACHAGGSTAIFGSAPLPALGVPSGARIAHQIRTSPPPPPSLPERPNWADLA